MCGIFGFLGDEQATPLLLDGLKRLEYRGYDSAGVAVGKDGSLFIEKTEGEVDDLRNRLEGNLPEGTSGMAHTRWATHGVPNETNAHPHPGCSGSKAVVHNGTITNADNLREYLVGGGHEFRSDTDTEVISHLLEEESGLEGAVQEAWDKLEGSFAFVAMSEDEDRLVGARNGSPLCLGLGEDGYYLASDQNAFPSDVEEAYFLGDDEMVVVEREGPKFLRKNGDAFSSFDPEVEEVDIAEDSMEKGGHPTFMHKEIYEQPRVVERNLDRLDGDEVVFGDLDLGSGYLEGLRDRNGRIVIVACGTSLYAGQVGEWIFEHSSRLLTESRQASNFRYSDPIVNEHDLVIGISQSGETKDTLEALKEAKRRGAHTLGVLNTPHSSIDRLVDDSVYVRADVERGVASTKAFTGQVVALNLLNLYFGQELGTVSDGERKRIVDGLRALPDDLREALEQENYIRRLAQDHIDRYGWEPDGRGSALFMGREINFPTAMEGALKLKEISYMHAEGYDASEMKHGPIALIDESMPTFFLANNGSDTYEGVLRSVEEVKARGGGVTAITDVDDARLRGKVDNVIRVPETHEYLNPLVMNVPQQLLAYHTADLLGRNIDKPRNLAKTITVE